MTLVRVVNTPQVDDALIWLLTFRDPADTLVLRAAANLEDITSNGDVYTAFPFDIVLPPDDGQRIASLELVFPNVGRELMQLVRAYQPGQYPKVRFDLIISDQPDVIEKTIDFMEVANVKFNAMNITFELTSSRIFARKTCVATYNQSEFPGLFWGLR
jgi:hypothetical protein